MSTIVCAIWGLSPRGCNVEAKIRRVSLGLTVYLIWEERNRRLFDDSSVSVEKIFRKFQILFYTTTSMIKTTLTSRLVNIWFACCPGLMHVVVDVDCALDSMFLSTSSLLATPSMLIDDGLSCSYPVLFLHSLVVTGLCWQCGFVCIMVLSLYMVKAVGCCLK